MLAPRWIRLYPVPFRFLGGDRQFRKYDLIDVSTRDAGPDKRPESRKISAESIDIRGNVKTWSTRAEWVERLPTPTMCAIQAAVRRDLNATSLAAVRPASADGLTFERHPGWTEDQRQRFEDYRNQGDLFNEVPARMLDAPRLVVRLRYRCQEPGCQGHEQRIIDWELTALQSHLRRYSVQDVKQEITQKFYVNPFGAGKAPLIFVGNQESPKRRASFTVLGLYYPKAEEAAVEPLLF